MRRYAYVALVSAMLTLASACPIGAQPSAQPPPTRPPQPPATAQPAAVQPITPAPTTAPAPTPVPGKDYIIGIGDVLHIIVWGNKDLEQAITVRPDGRISFPLAGELDARGLSVPQLTERLTVRLSDAIKGANVSIIVKEVRSFRVFVLGEVKRPGVYPIDASTPVLEALTLASGTADSADLPAAYVIRGDRKIPVDLRKLIQGGDLTLNIPLLPGDTVVVPQISIGANPQEIYDQRIYILGKVQKPGVYTIKKNVPILHAIFLAGGLTEGADMPSAFVVRGSERIPVNLWQLIQKGDLSQNVEIRPEDTIVVPLGGEMQNAVYIMGEVIKPGVYAQPEALTLLKLVALAGGFTKFAAPGRAKLIRKTGDEKALINVDLKDIMKDPQKYQDMPLQPGDVLIVPERLF
jgi:polysaccharide export outer membrane protein